MVPGGRVWRWLSGFWLTASRARGDSCGLHAAGTRSWLQQADGFAPADAGDAAAAAGDFDAAGKFAGFGAGSEAAGTGEAAGAAFAGEPARGRRACGKRSAQAKCRG